MAVHVVWFKRDLRVEDPAALAGAVEAGPVLGLFVFEPGLLHAVPGPTSVRARRSRSRRSVRCNSIDDR